MTVSNRAFVPFLRSVHRNSRLLARALLGRRRGSLRLQGVAVMAIAMVVCWGSYATGSYVAAQQALRERDARFYAAVMENAKMRRAFVLLSHDMSTLGVKESQLGDYAGTILKQYSDPSQKTDGQQDAMAKRIASLEHYVAELQKDKQEMTEAIRRTANERIAALEDIIETTGLSPKAIVREARRDGQWVIPISTVMEEPAASDAEKGTGGPNVPLSSLEFDNLGSGGKMFMDLERMVLLSNIVDSLPLGMPIAGAQKASGFGKRRDPIHRHYAMHTGIDLVGVPGAVVKSTGEGRVEFAGYKPEYGYTVDIDHGHGVVTRYAHLKKVLVRSGQKVDMGRQIGIQGSTGRSTGAHLHYEVRYFGKAINPARFLDAGKMRGNLS